MTISTLAGEFKNAPRDTSLVSSSVNDRLNREETLSVYHSQLPDNIDEENQLHNIMEKQHLRVVVYVLNMRGTPLMPTTPKKARILLKQKRAKVVQRTPFTIQLKYPTGETKQPITLGIDSGYTSIGFSGVSEKKELISGEVALRKDVSKKITERRMYRRNKRQRLRYRKPRFLNRVSSKKKGWLAPSILHKLESHIRLVKKIKRILPITKIIVEVAAFNIQKIKNPEIKGKEYQQGEQLNFWNLREYILHRDAHKCQNPKCKGKKKAQILEIHHLGFWKEDRTDRPNNLITLCIRCHTSKNHQKKGFLYGWQPKLKSFRSETFMSMVRWRLINKLECEYTYGYLTKQKRFHQNLSKSHVNDAFVIANGNSQQRIKPFNVKQMRRNNRSLQLNRKGFKRSIRKQRYKYQPNDLVRYNKSLYRVNGTHNKGLRVMLLDQNRKKRSISIQKIELIIYGKGLQFN